MLTVNQREGDSPSSWARVPTLKARHNKSNCFLHLHSHCECSLKTLVIHVLFLKHFSTAGLVCLFRVKQRFIASGFNCSRFTLRNVSHQTLIPAGNWSLELLNWAVIERFESNITTELCFVFTCIYVHYTRQIPFHLNSSVNSYLFCLCSDMWQLTLREGCITTV